MALDTKLKSDMASNAGGTTEPNRRVVPSTGPTTSSFTGPIEKVIPKEETTTKEEALSFSRTVFPVSEPPAAAETETMALLKSIEKQLKTLNQSVADLEQEVGNGKEADYRFIFSKIDSARCSIERVIASVGTTSSETADKSILDKIAELETIINGVSEKQDRNDRQLAQTLRENANFQIQVRQGMQRDIDVFKEQQSGEQFNPILKEIASMYVEYQSLLEDESITELSRKNLKALFEQFEDLLVDYDAEISRSEEGSVRQTRSTKIIGKIPTGDQNKHNTVAVSRKPGVMRGRTVLYPEFIDVFVFDPSIPQEVIEKEISRGTETECINSATQGAGGDAAFFEASEQNVTGTGVNTGEFNAEETDSTEVSGVNSENE